MTKKALVATLNIQAAGAGIGRAARVGGTIATGDRNGAVGVDVGVSGRLEAEVGRAAFGNDLVVSAADLSVMVTDVQDVGQRRSPTS